MPLEDVDTIEYTAKRYFEIIHEAVNPEYENHLKKSGNLRIERFFATFDMNMVGDEGCPFVLVKSMLGKAVEVREYHVSDELDNKNMIYGINVARVEIDPFGKGETNYYVNFAIDGITHQECINHANTLMAAIELGGVASIQEI